MITALPCSSLTLIEAGILARSLLTYLSLYFISDLSVVLELPSSTKNTEACCSACNHANDYDCNFCQKCGKRRTRVSVIDPPLVNVDSVRVKNRFNSLNIFRAIKPYQWQKSSLHRQLESYLWSLSEKKTSSMSSPKNVISFLVWRDKFGKTAVHSDQCTSLRK